VNTNKRCEVEIYSDLTVELINDYLFIDTNKSNNINVGVNEMTVNGIVKCGRDEKKVVE